jgi:hypothetical protein
MSSSTTNSSSQFTSVKGGSSVSSSSSSSSSSGGSVVSSSPSSSIGVVRSGSIAHSSGRAHSGGRGHSSKSHVIKQITKRGLLTSFNPATYTANVLIMEATSAFLQNVPVACHLDGTSAQVNANCLVFFFDEQNPGDAVILAMYPNGSQGIPTPAPGRVVFVTPFLQVNASVINAGNTSTFTLTGGSTGIPVGALGVIYKIYFTSPTAGAYVQIAPHSGTIGNYASFGNLSQANDTINGNGILAVDSAGKVDIKANTGNCTVTLYTHGYVF